MSDNFTYQAPNNQKYLQLLLRLLESKEETFLFNLLKDSKCVIDSSGDYSRDRWNAHYTTVYFYVPTANFDALDIDDESRRKLIKYCDMAMPKNIGFDVKQVQISPSLDDFPEEKASIEETSPLARRKTSVLSGALHTTSPMQSNRSIRIFISYRRSDSAHVAGRIYDRLVSEFGKENVFKDVDSIPLGVDFRDVLDKNLSSCTVFLTIIGVQWLNTKTSDGKRRIDDSDDFVRIEIESALQRKIPVIPVLVQGATIPANIELPIAIRSLAFRNAIPVRDDPDFHVDMDRLIRSIHKHHES